MGQVALPELKRYKYSGSLATGALAAGGTLGIMIPPSVPLVIYAVLTQESIGKLFMAGVVPGLMLATLLGLTTWVLARKKNYPRMPKASWGERWTAFRNSAWGLMLIVVVMGGIYSGKFTF